MLSLGEKYSVINENTQAGEFSLTFINENEVLIVRTVNPDRVANKEPLKVKQTGHLNDVFQVGKATVMILGLETVSNEEAEKKEAT